MTKRRRMVIGCGATGSASLVAAAVAATPLRVVQDTTESRKNKREHFKMPIGDKSCAQ